LNLFFNILSYYLSNDKSEKQIINCISYLNDLYSSPDIIWVMKSRRIKWAGKAARVGERRGVFRVLVEKLEGKTQA
jgi:ABC-type transport system involved in cytochrome bd biosynthesis fused ATPase/permease subunit